MKKKTTTSVITSVFRVIASNIQTGQKILLPDIFTTFAKSQEFAERMNNKYETAPVVFIATRNLSGISKKKLSTIFQQ